MDILIRVARMEHSQPIWQWRNDAQTRAMSRNQDKIAWEIHQEWYKRVLEDPCRHLFVGYAGESLFGMMRFDKCENEDCIYEISINLDPFHRGKGLGKVFLAEGIEKFWGDVADAKIIIAEIKDDNEASKKVFANAGFQEQGRGDSVTILRLLR